MKIHFILHESFEAPAAYLDWAVARGHDISMTKVYQYEKLPEFSPDIDMLIVMGGPQSPYQDKQQFPYYAPQSELAFMQQFIAADKIIIGICLGAQLLGEAYGAPVEHSPEKEIGHFPISLTAQGLADKRLATWRSGLVVGHWHGDMPGLTENAQVLASSAGCPRQIIKYADKHYAFQCHLEFNQTVLPLLIASEENLAQLSQQYPYVQTAQEILSYDYTEMNQALFNFLDTFES